MANITGLNADLVTKLRGLAMLRGEKFPDMIAKILQNHLNGVAVKIETAISSPKSPAYDVIITSAGAYKIKVIKAIRDITNLGLKEAKEVAEKCSRTGVALTAESADELIRLVHEVPGASAMLTNFNQPN